MEVSKDLRNQRRGMILAANAIGKLQEASYAMNTIALREDITPIQLKNSIKLHANQVDSCISVLVELCILIVDGDKD